MLFSFCSLLLIYTASTSTDPRYHPFVYDMLANLSANKMDTRIILNRGLTTADDESGGLGLRGKQDESLLESFDSSTTVKNLCASQYYHKMDFFLTFTCNQKKHFGVKNVKEWIDSGAWKQYFEGFSDLTEFEVKEIEDAVIQSAATLLLRNWQEVSKLFVDYLRHSPSSPYQNVNSIFVRYEYQEEKGNLSHIHLILEVKWDELTPSQKEFLEDLIRCSALEVVRSDEIQHLIDEGIFKKKEDVDGVVADARKFLPHRCNRGCFYRTGPGEFDFRCRKLNNCAISEDNTKHTFKPLPNEWSFECINRFIKMGLAEPICVNDEGAQSAVIFHDPYFSTSRHIPPTNPSDDENMSPVEGKTFSACRSMQNIQMLTNCGGVNKYVCKYIGKIDEKNYAVVLVDGRGQLVTKNVFLHNTKIATSKINEDKARETKRNKSNIQGRAISQNEMLHSMLKYSDVITDLVYINICTLPLEYRPGVDKCKNPKKDRSRRTNGDPDDALYAGCISDIVRCAKNDIQIWRQHTANEILTFDSVDSSHVSVDRISKFSLRPPELRYLFDNVRDYFRWFEYTSKYIDENDLNNFVLNDLKGSMFVDGLMQVVKVRENAFPEIMKYLEEIESAQNDNDDNVSLGSHTSDERNDAILTMSNFFREMNRVLHTDEHNLSFDDEMFLIHIKKNVVIEQNSHLPVPVFSYTRPTNGVQFLLHLMLSLGRFSTEIDLTTHRSIRECLRYAKLIGPSDDPSDLENYSNLLLRKWFLEQVVSFPNSKRVIQAWMVAAGELLDSVIVNDEIPVCDMPSVQQSTLFHNIEESSKDYLLETKSKIINAALKELGSDTIERCNIPSKEELMNATKQNPLPWDPVSNFSQSDGQPDSSFEEQKLAVELCKESISRYLECSNKFVKCTGIRGFPGSGKTWTMEYCIIFAVSQGLNIITTSQMARRSIQLGGKHLSWLFGLPIEKHIPLTRRSELAIQKILRNPLKLNFLLALDSICIDELGQNSAKTMAILDNILRKIRDNNIYFGGTLLMFTLDHLQIQPFDARPFLTSTMVIPCFQMVALETSVRASNDPKHQRIQQISRYSLRKLNENPLLIDEFLQLVSDSFTFVQDWSSNEITANTYRLYSKKFPAKEASRQYVERVRRLIHHNSLKSRTAEDFEKARFSHSEWRPATQSSIDQIEQQVKEPNEILFFRFAEYEFTFNEEGKFSHSQFAILYDLPSDEDLRRFRKIKVLAAPPGIQHVDYDSDTEKQYFLDLGFTEILVGPAPERTRALKSNTQAKRKQYGLKHRVTSTIHAAQGETLLKMATEISLNDPDFNLWDKGQLVVLLSRTKTAKDTIFVGNKSETLSALKAILMNKSQWSDYIETVLNIVTINSTAHNTLPRCVMNQNAFPFRIRDIALPQCRTGFVYFLISVKLKSFTYIGQCKCLRERLPQHNSGYGSESTAPAHLRPYGIMAYICGFDGDNLSLRLHIERQWKLVRNQMKVNGNNDPRQWARAGETVIQSVNNNESFNVTSMDLRLVCHFIDDVNE